MSDDVEWLSYPEISGRLGIGLDSAKDLVRRRRWQRRAGSHWCAPRIPRRACQAGMGGRDPLAMALPSTQSIPPIQPLIDGASAVAIAALERHVDRLESELAAAVAERDSERARAAQVEALKAVLEVERQRVADAQADAARWRDTATAPHGVVAWIASARAALKG